MFSLNDGKGLATIGRLQNLMSTAAQKPDQALPMNPQVVND